MPELYVFGSAASGEVDSESDLDVLVVLDDQERGGHFPPSWSVYSRSRVQNLYKLGTLFAWHLHLGAVKIFPRSAKGWISELGEPSPYSAAENEIGALIEIGADAVSELKNGTPSNVFELGIMYLVSRDIAMAASQIVLGAFTFSRFAPFQFKNPMFPLELAEYQYGMSCRRATTRGLQIARNFLTEEILIESIDSLMSWWRAVLVEVRHAGLYRKDQN
jgi:hypothetical protein